MPRLHHHRLCIANLEGQFPKEAIGYMSPDDAREELVRMTGQDFGLDPRAWTAWFKANPVRITNPIKDLKEVRRFLAEERRRRLGRG